VVTAQNTVLFKSKKV